MSPSFLAILILFILLHLFFSRVRSLFGSLVLVEPVRAIDEGLEPLEPLLIDRVHGHGVGLHLGLPVELLLAERTRDRIPVLVGVVRRVAVLGCKKN